MVDALREIHRILAPGGALLDLRPISGTNSVYLVTAASEVPYGAIDAYGAEHDDQAADAAIEEMLQRGCFMLRSRTRFEFDFYWDTAAEMRAFTQQGRRMRHAKFSYDDLEQRRAELSARVRCRRTMILNGYIKLEPLPHSPAS